MLNISSKPIKPTLLSIILPVYNERDTVADVVQNIHAIHWPLDFEIIAVNDGSTDGSREILEELQALGKLRAVHHEKNQGKGASVRTGIHEALGEITAIQDADLEYDPADLKGLLEPLLAGNADVVYGSRFKKSAWQVHRTFHMMINRFITLLSNLVSGIYLSDVETCYKVVRTDLLKALNLKTNRFGIEIEVTAYLAKLPVRIMEFPIHYFPRSFKEGKKISWRDGIAALYFIFRFNWFTPTRDCINPKAEVSRYLFRNDRKAG